MADTLRPSRSPFPGTALASSGPGALALIPRVRRVELRSVADATADVRERAQGELRGEEGGSRGVVVGDEPEVACRGEAEARVEVGMPQDDDARGERLPRLVERGAHESRADPAALVRGSHGHGSQAEHPELGGRALDAD